MRNSLYERLKNFSTHSAGVKRPDLLKQLRQHRRERHSQFVSRLLRGIGSSELFRTTPSRHSYGIMGSTYSIGWCEPANRGVLGYRWSFIYLFIWCIDGQYSFTGRRGQTRRSKNHLPMGRIAFTYETLQKVTEVRHDAQTADQKKL